MREVSLLRLYLLRAMYLLVVVGLGVFAVPSILRHAGQRELAQGIVDAMLLAFWLLCIVGLRYPLRMLPVLMWELVWKALWFGMVAWPAWRAGTMDAATAENAFACVFVVLVPIVMPWRYVARHYLREAGDPWRGARTAAAGESAVRRPGQRWRGASIR
jgi:hypothetical protein